MLAVRCGSRTDVGCVRSNNEDGLVIGDRLWSVADGMGGHAAGQVASRLVIGALAGLDDGEPLSQERVLEALASAHELVVSYGQKHPLTRGLGTTATGLALVGDGEETRWLIFNIGDSRVYHLADGGLSRITVDHSEVEELVAEGIVTREQARTHPMRNIITRSIGAPVPPCVDVWTLPIRLERFVVCSDGLTGELEDDQITAILRANPDPQDAADALVGAALESGGRDNVTVIVLDVDPDAAPSASA